MRTLKTWWVANRESILRHLLVVIVSVTIVETPVIWGVAFFSTAARPLHSLWGNIALGLLLLWVPASLLVVAVIHNAFQWNAAWWGWRNRVVSCLIVYPGISAVMFGSGGLTTQDTALQPMIGALTPWHFVIGGFVVIAAALLGSFVAKYIPAHGKSVKVLVV